MSDILGGGGRVERRTGSAPFGLEAAMRRIEGGDLREADARLVVQRLRECRSKTARWCEQAARTTLTDAEREAIAWLTKGESPFPEEEQRMATLRALLQRHEKGGEA